MPTIALDKTYVFNRKFYGPGPAVEVPDDFPLLVAAEDEAAAVVAPDAATSRGVRKAQPAPAATRPARGSKR